MPSRAGTRSQRRALRSRRANRPRQTGRPQRLAARSEQNRAASIVPDEENLEDLTSDLESLADLNEGLKNMWRRLHAVWKKQGAASDRDALANGTRPKDFPYWMLENVSHQIIPSILHAAYGKNARAIDFYGPRLGTEYGVPLWHFLLFFGVLSQPKVTALIDTSQKRKDLDFNGLYRELKHIRSQRKPLPDDPLAFTKADFKACANRKYNHDNDTENEEERNSDNFTNETSHGARSYADSQTGSENSGDDDRNSCSTMEDEDSHSVSFIDDTPEITPIDSSDNHVPPREPSGPVEDLLGIDGSEGFFEGSEEPQFPGEQARKHLEISKAIGVIDASELGEEELEMNITNITTGDTMSETCHDDTVDLASDSSELGNFMRRIEKKTNKFHRKRAILESRKMEVVEDIKRKFDDARQGWNPGQDMDLDGMLSEVGDLAQKHKAVMKEIEAHEAKKSKFQKDGTEWAEKLREKFV